MLLFIIFNIWLDYMYLRQTTNFNISIMFLCFWRDLNWFIKPISSIRNHYTIKRGAKTPLVWFTQFCQQLTSIDLTKEDKVILVKPSLRLLLWEMSLIWLSPDPDLEVYAQSVQVCVVLCGPLWSVLALDHVSYWLSFHWTLEWRQTWAWLVFSDQICSVGVHQCHHDGEDICHVIYWYILTARDVV